MNSIVPWVTKSQTWLSDFHFHSWGAVCIALAGVVISFHMILTLDVSYSAMALFSYFYDFGGKQLTKLDFLYVLKNLW